MAMDPIEDAVRAFIEWLSRLEGAERDKGTRAASNFEKSLAVLRSDRQAGIALLGYDVGGKGILDWEWSKERRATVTRFCDDIESALRKGA
jgi:hypothetical protein